MIIKMFSIRDSKAEAFLQPFFSQNRNTAIRAFENTVNLSDNPMNQHPEDYHLFEVGSFDQASGEVIPSTQPVAVMGAVEVHKGHGPVPEAGPRGV